MNEKPPLLIERISREGRKAKANKSQKPIKGNEKITRSQWERRLKIKLPEAMENVSDQVTIGFRFDSDWLLGWREFPGPITERCKPKQPRNIFDSQVEIFLCITALIQPIFVYLCVGLLFFLLFAPDRDRELLKLAKEETILGSF